MLVKTMDISRLMTHIEQIERKNLKKIKMRESKKPHFEGGFLHAKLDGSGHF